MSERSERIGAAVRLVSPDEGGPLSERSERIGNAVRLVSLPTKEGP